MAEKSQVKGIRTDMERPVRVPKPTNPDRGRMSYEEAMKDNERIKRANSRAEEIKQQILREELSGSSDEVIPKARTVEIRKASPSVEKIKELREKLADIETELLKDPESRGLKIQRGKIASQLDKLEKASVGE